MDTSAAKNAKILIVDDDRDNVSSARDSCSAEAGYADMP